MKKILALVVAFALCFTAVAGCFTAAAEDAVPTITIKDATAEDGKIVIPVEGTNLQSVDSYLITIVLPSDYTDIAVEGMTPAGENGGDYAVKGTSVKILNEIEKLDTDNDGAIAFNVTAKVPAVEADRVDDVTATVDAGNADAQPVDVTVVPGKATLKAPVVEPPHTHEWTYTYEVVADGSTYGKCVTTATCACEATEVVSEVANVKFSHAPVYESALTLIFRMPATSNTYFEGLTDIHAVITKDMYDDAGAKTTPDVSRVEVSYQANTGRVQFAYDGVRSVDMSSALRCEIYGTNADGIKVLAAVETYSFKEYIETAYNAYASAAAGSKNAAERQLVADIAYYGASAQTHFKYNAANLPNVNIPDTYVTPTIAVEDFDFDGNLVQSGAAFGRAPVYMDKIILNIRYAKDVATEGSYVVVDYTDFDGTEKQQVTNFADYIQDPSNSARYQTSFAINAGIISSKFNITLYNADGEELGSCEYGLEVYAYQATNAPSLSASEKALVNDLIAYGRSAKAFVNYGK